jgi:hypothetical protein
MDVKKHEQLSNITYKTHIKVKERRFIAVLHFRGIRISKENRQHNGQNKKYKRTNNDLQNIHIKIKNE